MSKIVFSLPSLLFFLLLHLQKHSRIRAPSAFKMFHFEGKRRPAVSGNLNGSRLARVCSYVWMEFSVIKASLRCNNSKKAC
ncbi:MAG: hypothetical protein IJF27_03105, partial [Oscillospiraceae bacterium]|nr:hypothetical protein [Oscillospiraceae bacterium]